MVNTDGRPTIACGVQPRGGSRMDGPLQRSREDLASDMARAWNDYTRARAAYWRAEEGAWAELARARCAVETAVREYVQS